jgi:hypothetical protein
VTNKQPKQSELPALCQANRQQLRRLSVLLATLADDVDALGILEVEAEPGIDKMAAHYLNRFRDFLQALLGALASSVTALGPVLSRRPFGEPIDVAAGLTSDIRTLADVRYSLAFVATEAQTLAGLLQELEAAPDAVQAAALPLGNLDLLAGDALGMVRSLRRWGKDVEQPLDGRQTP